MYSFLLHAMGDNMIKKKLSYSNVEAGSYSASETDRK